MLKLRQQPKRAVVVVASYRDVNRRLCITAVMNDQDRRRRHKEPRQIQIVAASPRQDFETVLEIVGEIAQQTRRQRQCLFDAF